MRTLAGKIELIRVRLNTTTSIVSLHFDTGVAPVPWSYGNLDAMVVL